MAQKKKKPKMESGHAKLVKAIREDLLASITPLFEKQDIHLAEISQKLTGHGIRLDGMDERFNGIEHRLNGMDKRFDGIDRLLGDIRVDLHDHTEKIM